MRSVRIAFKYAESEKPGACHIDLPTECSEDEGDSGTCRKANSQAGMLQRICFLYSSIDQAAAMIYQSKASGESSLDTAQCGIMRGKR